MKLAISNIAWDSAAEDALLPQLAALGISGIEVAPTKIAPRWEDITPEAVARYRRKMDSAGMAIPALQAILFGKPNLQVFDPSTHSAFLDHIRHVADIAADLGAKVLVFGAPKNRKRGQISMDKAWPVAVDFARRMGEICLAKGVILGWEHNPVEYGCDFITNWRDARTLIDAAKTDGLQLHLDAAGLHLCGSSIFEEVLLAKPFCHYHISEPLLVPIAGGTVDQSAAVKAVKQTGCVEWLSIEMKTPQSTSEVLQSVTYTGEFCKAAGVL